MKDEYVQMLETEIAAFKKSVDFWSEQPEVEIGNFSTGRHCSELRVNLDNLEQALAIMTKDKN